MRVEQLSPAESIILDKVREIARTAITSEASRTSKVHDAALTQVTHTLYEAGLSFDSGDYEDAKRLLQEAHQEIYNLLQ